MVRIKYYPEGPLYHLVPSWFREADVVTSQPIDKLECQEVSLILVGELSIFLFHYIGFNSFKKLSGYYHDSVFLIKIKKYLKNLRMSIRHNFVRQELNFFFCYKWREKNMKMWKWKNMNQWIKTLILYSLGFRIPLVCKLLFGCFWRVKGGHIIIFQNIIFT